VNPEMTYTYYDTFMTFWEIHPYSSYYSRAYPPENTVDFRGKIYQFEGLIRSLMLNMRYQYDI